MKIHTAIQALLIVSAFTLTTGHMRAANISFFRGITFESHSTFYEALPSRTHVTDIYTINPLAINLPNDSYDSLEFDIALRPGDLLIVDDVPGVVSTSINARWERADTLVALISNPYAVSYTNGSGDLPAETAPGILALSSNGNVIESSTSLTDVNGGFSFERMRISSSFGPYNADGAYENKFNQLVFWYEVSGNVSDPGRFTQIALVPEPTSLAMLGLGGLALMSRRKRGSSRL